MFQKSSDIYPKISIVTSNYNYGHFLEQTILSVLNQGYPNLEYIIIDGGSTDNSIEIIKKYEQHLAYWVSEKDEGVYDALNKGFSKCTGDLMAYLNSDDVYLPWSFQTVAEIFQSLPEVSWISTLQPGYIDHQSKSRWFGSFPGFSKRCFLDGRYAGRFSKYHFIQQESTFWRKELWARAGGKIDLHYRLAGDFYLWNEFYKHADLYGVKNPFSLFRLNHQQKSSHIEEYIDECLAILNFPELSNSNYSSATSSLLQNGTGPFQKLKRKLFKGSESYEGNLVQIKNATTQNAAWEVTTGLFRF